MVTISIKVDNMVQLPMYKSVNERSSYSYYKMISSSNNINQSTEEGPESSERTVCAAYASI